MAFNSIVVMERANGDKYVVDGQQRLLAAIRRGDIREVPCVLFKSDGREHEARAFISLNVRRTNVPAVAKFNASVRAALNPEKQIADWLASQGLTVTEDGKDMKGVDFPASLMQSWKLNDEAARMAIQVQRDVNGTEPLHSVCHKGLWWLIHNGVDVTEHASKLKRMGGRAAILRSVKTLEIETGAKASVRGCGIVGLDSIYNAAATAAGGSKVDPIEERKKIKDEEKAHREDLARRREEFDRNQFEERERREDARLNEMRKGLGLA